MPEKEKHKKHSKKNHLAVDDEDEEIRKAIELSKQTALIEEKKRIEEIKNIS